MTTRTDYNSIRELNECYDPEQPGFVSEAEIELIREKLEIEARTTLELQNVRDMAVMVYDIIGRTTLETDAPKTFLKLINQLSAITCVIDQEAVNRRCKEAK